MTQAYVVTFKWGMSRGRNSQGYTICTCFVDGQKLGTTCGGGYDLRGAAFANAMLAKFGPELLALADLAHTKYRVTVTPPTGRKRKPEHRYERLPDSRDGRLYGLTAFFGPGNAREVQMDGACGFSSMERIMEAAGYKVEFVTDDVYKLVKNPVTALAN